MAQDTETAPPSLPEQPVPGELYKLQGGWRWLGFGVQAALGFALRLLVRSRSGTVVLYGHKLNGNLLALAVPVVVRALHTAEQVADAIDARSPGTA